METTEAEFHVGPGGSAPGSLGERARRMFGDLHVDAQQDADERSASLNGLITALVTSKDGSLLDEILDVKEFAVIESSVVALAIGSVAPFLDILMQRLSADHPLNLSVLYWVQAVLLHHMNYLMSLPSDVLRPLHAVLTRSSRSFVPLMELDAKLSMLLSNSTQAAQLEERLALTMPVYIEDEEDDEDEEEDEQDEQDDEDSMMMALGDE